MKEPIEMNDLGDLAVLLTEDIGLVKVTREKLEQYGFTEAKIGEPKVMAKIYGYWNVGYALRKDGYQCQMIISDPLYWV